MMIYKRKRIVHFTPGYPVTIPFVIICYEIFCKPIGVQKLNASTFAEEIRNLYYVLVPKNSLYSLNSLNSLNDFICNVIFALERFNKSP